MTTTNDFPTIPDHTKLNYRERVAAGEKWLDMHVQAVRDGYDDLAEWFKAEADAAGEKVKTSKPRKAAESTPEPESEVVEPTPEPVDETPAP